MGCERERERKWEVVLNKIAKLMVMIKREYEIEKKKTKTKTKQIKERE